MALDIAKEHNFSDLTNLLQDRLSQQSLQVPEKTKENAFEAGKALGESQHYNEDIMEGIHP